MRTLGIDLAAGTARTGLARLEWDLGNARVMDLCVGADDDVLVQGITTADRTGIDCPLGWPREFVKFISAHQDGHVVAQLGAAQDWRRLLSYRVTDLHLKNTVPGIQGLSVSSDRIGVTSMRCAALLSRLDAMGQRVSRTGDGTVVEVYPAASLVRWGFNHKGYKGRKAKARRNQLVDELLSGAPWLDLGSFEDVCRASDDALDAVLASMTARAASLGLTEQIPPEHRESAEVEGWIALPRVGTGLGTSRHEPSPERDDSRR